MPGFLVLETGEVFEGKWSGQNPAVGEVVFNTSHSGYEEIATDPSYFSQIVVMTAPMMGNYDCSKSEWESRRIWIEGFICLQMNQSNHENSWQSVLQNNKVAILSEADTRQITLRLRSGGTPWGVILEANDSVSALNQAHELILSKKKLDSDWVYLSSRTEIEKFEGELTQPRRVVLYDFGAKQNIIRILQKLASEVIVVPARTSAEMILKDLKPDYVFLSNGPGDPSEAKQSIEQVKKLIGQVPVMGVCMGHQILSLALGAQTYKMKFGHRGSNHPIQDQLLNQVYVSSQNHGYAVDAKTLPKNVKVTHVNLNDQTVAGFYSSDLQVLGIQYHPEASPGPHDAQELFQFFIQNNKGVK